MAKWRIFLLLVCFTLFASGCQARQKLLLLNWGEYINEEAVELFEAEYNVDVIINIASSNEMFYAKLKSGTTAYDLVIPSEYMVEKMVSKGLLQKIDYDLLTNYDPINNHYLPGVKGIQGEMFSDYEDYAVPYLWGTFGLMYNKKVQGLEEAILTYGWDAYFDASKRPANTRVGMYDVPRFAYAAALLANGESPNLASNEALELARTTLSKVKYSEWGTDTLKKGIAANNLDLAFVYTGDFLDMYYVKLENNAPEDIMFDIYIPDETIAFMDTFVIPKKARHLKEAHQFIDFFLRPEIAYLNASVIGYCTPLIKTYEQITTYEGEDEWLTSWAYANRTYYPLPEADDPKQYKGTPLSSLDPDFLAAINTMVNNVKAEG
jgi:spermidine/putrescine-binding protein